MKKAWALLIVGLILAGCAKEVPVQEEVVEESPAPLKPIDISSDPKKQEVLVFISEFIKTIAFPSPDGNPVIVDGNSFKMVGFLVVDKMYTVITQFELKTFQGPMKKQFTMQIEDQGNGVYEIRGVREDK